MLGKRYVARDNEASFREEKRPRSDLADVLNARFFANDRRERPAGLIFMCSSLTKRDCFRYKVFGLPLAKKDLVERVTPGMRLFLFDFDSRELHGIYEAVSHGGMSLEPMAFQNSKGSYPAQVRFATHRECMPLSEGVFKDAIKENYYSQNKFDSELSSDQVLKLTQLFHGTEHPRKPTDSLQILGRLHQGERLGQGLLGRSIHVSDPLELSYGGSQYGLVSQASRMEGRIPEYTSLPGHLAQNVDERGPLPRRDPIDPSMIFSSERLGHHPRHIDVVDKERLVQTQPSLVGYLTRAAGLLGQDGIEEADRLALKYLQPNPVVDKSGLLSVEDHLSRQLSIPRGQRVTPLIGNMSASQQFPGSSVGLTFGNVSAITTDPLSGGPAIGNASAVQAGLLSRSMSRSIYGPISSTSNIGTVPSAVALRRRNRAGDFLRQQRGRGSVRRA